MTRLLIDTKKDNSHDRESNSKYLTFVNLLCNFSHKIDPRSKESAVGNND